MLTGWCAQSCARQWQLRARGNPAALELAMKILPPNVRMQRMRSALARTPRPSPLIRVFGGRIGPGSTSCFI